MSIPGCCSICLGGVPPTLATVSGPDHPDLHYFHPDCIRRWINQNLGEGLAPTCPLCRRSIAQITFDQTEVRIPLPSPRPESHAILSANLVRVQALLGDDQLDIPQDDLATAIFLAMGNRNLAIVQTILESGRLHNREEFRYLLIAAAESGVMRYVQLILEHGEPFSITNRIEAAILARQEGHREIASYLCRGCGISITTVLTASVSALIIAGSVLAILYPRGYTKTT